MAVRPVVFLGLLLTVALTFTLYPQVDLWVSGSFYRIAQGFHLRDVPVIQFIHNAIPPFAVGTGIALVALLAWTAWTGQTVFRLSSRMTTYLLATLIIGPGLLTNTVLKDHWGRARPSQIVEFGGKSAFTPALVISDQCNHNCSFVCGHAAMAFTPIALAFVLPTRRQRRLALASGLGFGGLVGAVRIVEGGHFLSDVLFAGLLVYGVAWVLAWLLSPQMPADGNA